MNHCHQRWKLPGSKAETSKCWWHWIKSVGAEKRNEHDGESCRRRRQMTSTLTRDNWLELVSYHLSLASVEDVKFSVVLTLVCVVSHSTSTRLYSYHFQLHLYSLWLLRCLSCLKNKWAAQLRAARRDLTVSCCVRDNDGSSGAHFDDKENF